MPTLDRRAARRTLLAALLIAPAGCGGDDTVTIMPTAPVSEEQAKTRLQLARTESEAVAAQERANNAGQTVAPRDLEAERVEALERANNASFGR